MSNTAYGNFHLTWICLETHAENHAQVPSAIAQGARVLPILVILTRRYRSPVGAFALIQPEKWHQLPRFLKAHRLTRSAIAVRAMVKPTPRRD